MTPWRLPAQRNFLCSYVPSHPETRSQYLLGRLHVREDGRTGVQWQGPDLTFGAPPSSSLGRLLCPRAAPVRCCTLHVRRSLGPAARSSAGQSPPKTGSSASTPGASSRTTHTPRPGAAGPMACSPGATGSTCSSTPHTPTPTRSMGSVGSSSSCSPTPAPGLSTVSCCGTPTPTTSSPGSLRRRCLPPSLSPSTDSGAAVEGASPYGP